MEYPPDTTNNNPQMPAVRDQFLKVPEVARLLRISKNLCYLLIAERRIPSHRFGRNIRVSRIELETMIATARPFEA